MDQGLKERLVGAAVLVAIAVWLIPWVLDGPEEGAEAPASSLQLPSAEEPMPMRTQTLELGDAPEQTADSARAPVATPTPQPAAAPPEAAKDATASPRVPETQSEPRLAAATGAADRPAAAPPKAEPAAAAPKPESKAQGDWTVQLGSFEDEGNAKRLAQRAGTFGYKAEVSSSRSGGKTLYRVRVGPQATRAAADAAASALRARGVEARVVAAR